MTGLKLYEGFGQSESSVLIANFSPWITPKPGSTGKPSPLYDIDLINSEGKPCEDGEEGEIVVRLKGHDWPTGLFTGYYLDDEMTKANLGGEWYNTKDVAWRDSNGYFWFVGRNDAPDPIRGQVVKATVVLAKGYASSPELTKELQNYVKKVTAPYKYPRIIEYVDELPKTLGGKIKRAEIRHRDHQ